MDNDGSSGSRAAPARPRLGGRAPRGAGGAGSASASKPPYAVDPPGEGEELPPELEGCDPALVQRILAEIMDSGDPVTFDDIAGLAHVKECVREAVILPMKRPDLFTGLRAAPKGVLLFGPPGTGKTLIGKAVAAQAGATFFSISSSSIGSKWQGESERLVRTLFAVAAYKQPSVVFIDEIDSLLTMRGEGEQEITRRIKTEFLVQLDGAGTKSDTRVLVIGATNRPQELDEAARRRFTQKLYVELPHADSRQALIARLLSAESQALPEMEMRKVVRLTRGFSGADLHNMCREAAMHVLRKTMQLKGVEGTSAANLPPIRLQDFEFALSRTRPSVAPEEVTHYIKWNGQFGSTAIEPPSDDDDDDDGGGGGSRDAAQHSGAAASAAPSPHA